VQRGQLFRPDSLERRARHAGNGEENEEAPGEGGGEVVVCWGRTRRARGLRAQEGLRMDGRSAEGPGRAHLGSGKTEGPRSPFIYIQKKRRRVASYCASAFPTWVWVGGCAATRR
jgi:hypothetical protein